MIKKINKLNIIELRDNSKIRKYIYKLLLSVRTPNKWACEVSQVLSNIEHNAEWKTFKLIVNKNNQLNDREFREWLNAEFNEYNC